jgi:hypothetical protein
MQLIGSFDAKDSVKPTQNFDCYVAVTDMGFVQNSVDDVHT